MYCKTDRYYTCGFTTCKCWWNRCNRKQCFVVVFSNIGKKLMELFTSRKLHLSIWITWILHVLFSEDCLSALLLIFHIDQIMLWKGMFTLYAVCFLLPHLLYWHISMFYATPMIVKELDVLFARLYVSVFVSGWLWSHLCEHWYTSLFWSELYTIDAKLGFNYTWCME